MTNKQGKGESKKEETKYLLSCIRPWIQDNLKKGSHLYIDQQSSTGIKGPSLKIYRTAFTGREKNCSEKLFQPCPCPALPSVTDSSFSASPRVRISAGVKSGFTAGIRVCRVVYSPRSEKCFPVPPQLESRLLQHLKCFAQLWLFWHRNNFWDVQRCWTAPVIPVESIPKICGFLLT